MQTTFKASLDLTAISSLISNIYMTFLYTLVLFCCGLMISIKPACFTIKRKLQMWYIQKEDDSIHGLRSRTFRICRVKLREQIKFIDAFVVLDLVLACSMKLNLQHVYAIMLLLGNSTVVMRTCGVSSQTNCNRHCTFTAKLTTSPFSLSLYWSFSLTHSTTYLLHTHTHTYLTNCPIPSGGNRNGMVLEGGWH